MFTTTDSKFFIKKIQSNEAFFAFARLVESICISFLNLIEKNLELPQSKSTSFYPILCEFEILHWKMPNKNYPDKTYYITEEYTYFDPAAVNSSETTYEKICPVIELFNNEYNNQSNVPFTLDFSPHEKFSLWTIYKDTGIMPLITNCFAESVASNPFEFLIYHLLIMFFTIGIENFNFYQIVIRFGSFSLIRLF